jgi:hypothetical protein
VSHDVAPHSRPMRPVEGKGGPGSQALRSTRTLRRVPEALTVPVAGSWVFFDDLMDAALGHDVPRHHKG